MTAPTVPTRQAHLCLADVKSAGVDIANDGGFAGEPVVVTNFVLLTGPARRDRIGAEVRACAQALNDALNDPDGHDLTRVATKVAARLDRAAETGPPSPSRGGVTDNL